MWTEPLYTAEEMRAAEEAHGGPMLELMERAGTAAAEAVLRRYPDAGTVAVWCGTGSNGGDGFVVARKLHEAGRTVEIVFAGPEEKVVGDARENLERARKLKIPFTETGGGDVAVDALFGTGFSGKPRDDAVRLIQALNGLGAPILSVDVPSGVNVLLFPGPGRISVRLFQVIAVSLQLSLLNRSNSKLPLAILLNRSLPGCWSAVAKLENNSVKRSQASRARR